MVVSVLYFPEYLLHVYYLSALTQVPLNSVAGEAGCRSNDYLVKINGVDVFQMSHDKAKQLIRDGGDKLSLVIERYGMYGWEISLKCDPRRSKNS